MTSKLIVIPEIEEELKNNINQLQGVNKRLYLNKCLYIISEILLRNSTQAKYYSLNGVGFRIHSNTKEHRNGTLTHLFGGPSKKVVNILHTLICWEMLIVFKHPEKGKNSTRYKLHDRFNNKPHSYKNLTPEDGAFAKRILSAGTTSSDSLCNKILDIYRHNLSLSDDGEQFILDGGRESKSDLGLKMIKDGVFYASRGPKNGRLDHNLTSLKSDHRKFLLLDGKPLMDIDIVNSQPIFSVAFIKEYLQKNKCALLPSSDVLIYENECCSGRLYESLSHHAGIDISDAKKRQKFKKRFFAEVFYCDNDKGEGPLKCIFRKLYPTVLQTIEDIKANDYRDFAVQLQRLESSLMIDHVFKSLIDAGHIALPLHDAIYCSDEKTLSLAKNIVSTAFESKYQMKPEFK